MNLRTALRGLFRAEQPPLGAARQHIVNVGAPSRLSPIIANGSALRRRAARSPAGVVLAGEQSPKRGMWVMYQRRIGILTALEPGDVATVMLVDDKGLNALEVHAPARELRQAWFDEIPSARRPAWRDAVTLGYDREPKVQG